MAHQPLRPIEDTPMATSPLVLVALILLCLGVAAIGGAITASSVETWYPALHKPELTPPDWVFAPLWTAIYLIMALVAWRVWGQRRRVKVRIAFGWLAVQLLLNLVWTTLFFGLRSLNGALIAILLLLASAIVTTIIVFRIDRAAGWLMVPYLGWAAFAAWLMVAVWRLNSA